MRVAVYGKMSHGHDFRDLHGWPNSSLTRLNRWGKGQRENVNLDKLFELLCSVGVIIQPRYQPTGWNPHIFEVLGTKAQNGRWTETLKRFAQGPRFQKKRLGGILRPFLDCAIVGTMKHLSGMMGSLELDWVEILA